MLYFNCVTWFSHLFAFSFWAQEVGRMAEKPLTEAWHGPLPLWSLTPLLSGYHLAETRGDRCVVESGFLIKFWVNSAPFLMALITEGSVNRADSTGWVGQIKGSIQRWLMTLTLKELSLKGRQKGLHFRGLRPHRDVFHPSQALPLFHSAVLDCWEEAIEHTCREPQAPSLFSPALLVGPF